MVIDFLRKHIHVWEKELRIIVFFFDLVDNIASMHLQDGYIFSTDFFFVQLNIIRCELSSYKPTPLAFK